jgi:hypothetical protein
VTKTVNATPWPLPTEPTPKDECCRHLFAYSCLSLPLPQSGKLSVVTIGRNGDIYCIWGPNSSCRGCRGGGTWASPEAQVMQVDDRLYSCVYSYGPAKTSTDDEDDPHCWCCG